MLRNYSSHFAGSTHFYSTKAGGRKMGLRGWGLTGTLIDMSSFYLFSLELRRHSETTFHYGVSPLTDAVRPDFFSRQIYCSNGPFSFPHETSAYEFVTRTIRVMYRIMYPYCASFYTKNARPPKSGFLLQKGKFSFIGAHMPN